MENKQLPKLDHNIILMLIVVGAIAVLIILFNSTSLINYFRGISKAAIININPEIPVLNESAREDILLDLAENGLAYLSVNPSNNDDTRLLYYNFATVTSIMFGTNNIAAISSAKTNDNYVIYSKDFTIYWHNINNIPYAGTPIPKGINDKDISCDIAGNNKIIFARQSDGATNLWQYQIGADSPEQLTFINSYKQDINYYYDDLTGAEKIVWTDDRNGNFDIYLYDFADANPNGVQITTDLTEQSAPSIYQNKITWSDARNGANNWDIYLYDLNNPTAGNQQITTNTTDQRWGTIYNQKIVWEDARNDASTGPWTDNKDIYMYDLHDGKEYAVSAIPPDQPMTGDQLQPQIMRNKIVWTYAHGMAASGSGPNQDIFMTTYDELNIISPETDIHFNFEDIPFAWEFNSDISPMPNFWMKVLWNDQNAPFLPTGKINVGPTTFFPLKSERIEYMPDGLWEWAIAPEINGEYEPYWSEFRTIYKKTAAELVYPENGGGIHLGESFDWDDVPGAINYVAKIEGFLPGEDQPYYYPLNSPISQFSIDPVYNFLQPGVEYTWAITGTGLATWLPNNPNHPDYVKIASLYFAPGFTFHRE
ncbi:hypothetical protein KJ836_01300 [Patescibacteria group bacterium]|nr:hypothetical protein [Patescibacteria group bacterium]